MYTIEDLSEAVYPIGDHEGTLRIEYDDISIKTKLVLIRFGGTFRTLILDEKSFSNKLLGFIPYWHCKPTNAIHANSIAPGIYAYTCKKILSLSTIYEIHLKCDVIDGRLVNGLREPILFSFILDKPSDYKVFCEPETIH